MMAWTKQCHMYHNQPVDRNYWGQNLYSVGNEYYNFTWTSIAETVNILGLIASSLRMISYNFRPSYRGSRN